MGKFKKQTCCFTGHRNIPPGEQTKILTRVRHRLIPLIQSGIIYYGVGGALGFDTLVAEMLIELKKENGRLRIIEVLPFEGYRDRWTPEQQLHAKNLDKKMDKIVYVSKEPSKSAYLTRDRHLVDCSDYCISYCTKQTSNLKARTARLPISLLASMVTGQRWAVPQTCKDPNTWLAGNATI